VWASYAFLKSTANIEANKIKKGFNLFSINLSKPLLTYKESVPRSGGNFRKGNKLKGEEEQ